MTIIEKKIKYLIIITFVMLFLIIGNIIPIIFHEEKYVFYDNIFTVVDVKKDFIENDEFLKNEDYKEFLGCIKFGNLYPDNPIGDIGRLLFLRKVTVVGKNPKGDYMTEWKGIFNLKFDNNGVSRKINHMIENEGGCF